MAGTIRQIAQITGVSRGTVDRVLNHRGRVRPEVAKRVEEAAKELCYTVKHPLTDPETPKGDRKRIGVVTQLSGASFMIAIRQGILDAARKMKGQEIDVLLRESASVDENEQIAAIDELVELGIDALAIMPVDCNGVRVKLEWVIREMDIPVITFNTDIVGTGRLCFVGLNNQQSGRTAAGLMGMMLQGKGRVLGITGNFANSTGGRRIAGFVEEMRESFPEMELIGVQSSFDKTEEVEQIIVNAMNAYPDLSGILVVSGGQAGVKQAFEKLNLNTHPRVILYDLTPKNMAYLREGIADFLIDQEGYEQGYRAVSLLADKICRGEDPGREYMYTDINIKSKYNI